MRALCKGMSRLTSLACYGALKIEPCAGKRRVCRVRPCSEVSSQSKVSAGDRYPDSESKRNFSYLYDLEQQVKSLKRQLSTRAASSNFSDAESSTITSGSSSPLAPSKQEVKEPITCASSEAASRPAATDKLSCGISLASFVHAEMVKSHTPIMSSLWMQGLSIIHDPSGFLTRPEKDRILSLFRLTVA
jgi:hypothetical protein